jgi:3',5'-cyclic AMP phosphodiesterase CpdA
LGDITDYNSKSEWLEAQRVISKMDGIVPYSLTPGNHDGSTKWFAYSVLKNIPGEKTLFLYDLLDGTEGTVDSDEGVDLYKADKYFETFFSVDGPYANQFAYCYDKKPNNTIHLFSGADNLKYMVVALDYGATDEALAWASDIIKQHPKRNVIVTTHGYMWADGRYITSADGGMAQTSGMNGSRANNGDKLWEKFVSQHKNITMLICGHVDHDVIVYRQDKGVNGNMVTQMLCDPQGIDVKNVGQPLIQKYGDSIYNRLVGMVATYYVSADGKTIDVEWYSPIQKAYYTERGQFTFTTDVVAN